MILFLLYAASVIAAFVGWYVCGPLKSVPARGVARASLIALLRAPGVLVGHGVGVAPTLFALVVQPSVFTLGSIGIVWLITLAAVFGIPASRRQQNGWPPSLQEIFINGYIFKFLLFGLVYGVILVSIFYLDESSWLIEGIKYSLFLVGALINFALCFHATRLKNANAYLTPLLFAAPVFFGAAPPVSLLWFGGGIAGTLVARGRQRLAAWSSLPVFGLLAAYALERSYHAIDAPSHVNVQGGVAGSAAIAALFVVLAISSWYWLRRIGSDPSA